jgi:hypothetical protein
MRHLLLGEGGEREREKNERCDLTRRRGGAEKDAENGKNLVGGMGRVQLLAGSHAEGAEDESKRHAT